MRAAQAPPQVPATTMLALADVLSFRGTSQKRVQLVVLPVLESRMPGSQAAAAELLERARNAPPESVDDGPGLLSATAAAIKHGVRFTDLRTGFDVLCKGGEWEQIGTRLLACCTGCGSAADADAAALQLGRVVLLGAHGDPHAARMGCDAEPAGSGSCTGMQVLVYGAAELEAACASSIRVLGEGTFGQVLEVRLHDEPAALKVPKESSQAKPSHLAAELAWAMKDEHVVRVMGFGRLPG